jgi:hypothetical protein
VGITVAQFTPRIQAYVTMTYQQNQMMRGAIMSPLLLTQDLLIPTGPQRYMLSISPATGGFILTPF